MKTLRILLFPVLALAPNAQALAFDRVLPRPRIEDNGDVRLSHDLKIDRTGRFQGGKFRPPGAGDDLIVSPGTSAYGQPLSRRLGKTVYASDDGVICDGTTNITAQTQFAIARAIAKGGTELVFPPGICLFGSVYPSGRTERGLGPYNIKVQGAKGLRISGARNGTTIFKQATGANNGVILWVNESENVEISDIAFAGNHEGITAGQYNTALCIYSVKNFRVSDITTDANFNGSVIHGNWQFNGVYARITQSIAPFSSGFDVASWQNVTIRDWTAVGGGISSQGLHLINDSPNADPSFNLTGIPLRGGMSNNVFIEGPDLSRFQTALVIQEANNVLVRGGSLRDNAPSSSADTSNFWTGMTVGGTATGKLMQGIRVVDTVISGNGNPNGDPALNGGILLNSNEAEVRASIAGVTFADNANAAIINLGTLTVLDARENTFENRTIAAPQATKISGIKPLK